MIIEGNIVSIHQSSIFYGKMIIENKKIESIEKLGAEDLSKHYFMPGFVDAHVHIESSMLVPSEFAKLALPHGTVATVSDPHEIANVLGVKGVDFMIENGKQAPLMFYFGAPSCVPATAFETAGAEINAKAVQKLLERSDIVYLTEMMNYPGVIYEDAEVMAKIKAAHDLGKPVDGHAPGVSGKDLKKYFDAGISTDHECFTKEEGLEKLQLGMKVLIREGSAAKNFDSLIDLLKDYPDQIMFCSDDKHPDDLVDGHINTLAARAVKKRHDVFSVLKATCSNPILHYGLDVGLMRQNDWADFIEVKDLKDFEVIRTFIRGEKVAEKGKSFFESPKAAVLNCFNCLPKEPADFKLPTKGNRIQVIKAIDGELVTERFVTEVRMESDNAVSNEEKDVLKFCVINRYQNVAPAIGFINGFNLKNGAIASCVGHDSHNILVVGTDDELICQAANLIIENKGGISAVNNEANLVLPLPIAGIMTNKDGYEVAKSYSEMDSFVKTALKSTLNAPFMTLSFMALLVIPKLKLSDKGLFDGGKFEFSKLFL